MASKGKLCPRYSCGTRLGRGGEAVLGGHQRRDRKPYAVDSLMSSN